MATIEITDLGRSFADRPPLGPVSLRVAAGEAFGLLGPLGAGRSTLLKILAGILPPDSGQGCVAGWSLADAPGEVRARVGYWPGFTATYEDMRVQEYLEFFGLAYRVDSSRLGGRIEMLLALAGLGRRRDDPISALDPESRQRLGLVKTLVHDPPVVLLDEPALGFDPAARTRIRALTGEFRAMGKTLVISSNLVMDLAGVCGRIGVMHHGRLLLEGAADDVLRQLAGERLIELALAGDPSAAQAAAAAHPAVRQAVPHGKNVVFSLADAAGDPAGIIADLLARGIPIAAWREHEIQPEGLLERHDASNDPQFAANNQ